MAQYVDIMTDAGFKAVFQDKQVTIKFLNAALAGERQIKDITYLDKEIKPEIVENRTIIFDLLCEDVSGAKFILEMQNCPQYYFFNRGFLLSLSHGGPARTNRQAMAISVATHLRSLFLEFQVAGVHRLPYGCCPR